MMQTNEYDFDLLEQMSQLSINQSKKRQTDLIDIVQMDWNKPNCTLNVQYKHLYVSRMKKLQKRLNRPGIVSISNVTQDEKKYTIRGILKRLEYQRVRAFQKDFKAKYNNYDPIYTPDDELQVQDNTGKLNLTIINAMTKSKSNSAGTTINNSVNIDSTDLPYGVQVVLEGRFKKLQNKFVVKNIICPSFPPQMSYIPGFMNKQGVSFENKKILVMSEPTIQQLMNIKPILKNNSSKFMFEITALIIIGGFEAKIQEINVMSDFVNELKGSIDVFIMPSSNNDRRKLFPQQPLSNLFFPKQFKQIGMCSNPQLFKAQNGLNINISCGENALDFMKNCSLAKNSLQVLQNFVRFSHYAPTCPFSLKTEPFSQDYLVMEELPHVIIVGKSNQFGSRMMKVDDSQVLLVTIQRNGMGLIGLNGKQAHKFT